MDELELQKLYLLLGVLESKIKPKIIIPTKHETATISEKPMTAALFYDRVWCPTIDVWGYSEKMPDEVRFFGGTNEENIMSFQGFTKMRAGNCNVNECKFPTLDKCKKSKSYKEIFKKSTLSFHVDLNEAQTKEDVQDVLKKAFLVPQEEREQYIYNSSIISGCIYKDIALAFSQRYGKEVTTIYPTKEINDAVYQEGDMSVIVSTIDNLNIVDENSLTWKQVLEFRHDMESRKKYKRFLHWLDKEMLGKSKSYIEDEISCRLGDYENVLRKHGIKTILGTIEEVLDGKFLINSAIASGIVAATTEPLLGLLAETCLIISNIAIKLAKKKLDYEDIEMGNNSEISWVYEVKKISSSK